MGKKAIMEIHIDNNGEIVTMKSDFEEVVMIPFKGYVNSPLITGIVEPCGVDTQIVNAAGVRHMSARYMITGKDSDGNDVHLYIENNGWFDDEHKTMPFHTVPTFYTDSNKIRSELYGKVFYGVGEDRSDGLWICFYEK